MFRHGYGSRLERRDGNTSTQSSTKGQDHGQGVEPHVQHDRVRQVTRLGRPGIPRPGRATGSPGTRISVPIDGSPKCTRPKTAAETNTAHPGVVRRSRARSSAPRNSSSSATGASTPTARKISGIPRPVDRAAISHRFLAGDRRRAPPGATRAPGSTTSCRPTPVKNHCTLLRQVLPRWIARRPKSASSDPRPLRRATNANQAMIVPSCDDEEQRELDGRRGAGAGERARRAPRRRARGTRRR